MTDFQHDAAFEQAGDDGGLGLDRYEAAYQQLFSEALEDGVITAEERQRLERAAETLGLDPARLKDLEKALEGAYHAHHGIAPLHTTRMFAALQSIVPSASAGAAIPGPAPASQQGDELAALRARVRFLEERVHQLETELAEAQAQVAVEVDLSELEAPVPSAALEEPEALHRRLRHDPRDTSLLHSLVQAHAGNLDRQWCIASALVHLGDANAYERELYEEHKPSGLIAPKQAVDAGAWSRWLLHPHDESETSDILGVIVSAVLLAHSSTLKSKGQLPELPAERRLDPSTSTVAAARAFGWAAQSLGVHPPLLYGAPEADVAAQMVPTVPPSCLLGKRLLSGRSPLELAFVAGHHVAHYRRERFIRLVVPEIVDLEDLFLSALLIANRALPLNSRVKARVEPIAGAIEPLLEATELDRLRGAYKRFVEHGGRTNLQRWATASDLTAARAGFVLAGDLSVAEAMLGVIGAAGSHEIMDDLILFATSDRYSNLRAHLGIALGGS